jgi:hypothetical protein
MFNDKYLTYITKNEKFLYARRFCKPNRRQSAAWLCLILSDALNATFRIAAEFAMPALPRHCAAPFAAFGTGFRMTRKRADTEIYIEAQ